MESSSLYQQLMLVDETELLDKRDRYTVRNNVIHLTIANKKPVILTKSQYEKVKKAIQIKILKAASAKKCAFKKTSFVSVSDPLKRKYKSNKGKKTMHKSTQTFGLIPSDDDVKSSDNLKPEREIQTTDYEIQYYNESSASLSLVRIDNTNVEDNELGKRYSSLSSIKRVKFDKEGNPDCEIKDLSGDCTNDADIPYSVKTIFQYQGKISDVIQLNPKLKLN